VELVGKTVLVTGAAHGIGRATAQAFASKGSKVVIADIDAEAADDAAAGILTSGGEAISLQADVSSEEQFNGMVDRVIDEYGALDVMVSNAGVSVSGPPEATPIEDWRWIVDVNMWPHVFAVRRLSGYFKQRGSGHFVHVASAAGIFGTPGLSAYTMTKFAVFGLAESLAVSLQGTGVGVSVVCPLWVDTEITMRGRLTPDPEMGIDGETLKMLGREMLRMQGIPPEKVADSIVGAVETGRFLVLPHPEVLDLAQGKWGDPDAYIARAAAVVTAQREMFGETMRAASTEATQT
jgi:NAD(P)-dependent dehydrogenase (short-subunit alcohol dehydrogenase family)